MADILSFQTITDKNSSHRNLVWPRLDLPKTASRAVFMDFEINSTKPFRSVTVPFDRGRSKYTNTRSADPMGINLPESGLVVYLPSDADSRP